MRAPVDLLRSGSAVVLLASCAGDPAPIAPPLGPAPSPSQSVASLSLAAPSSAAPTPPASAPTGDPDSPFDSMTAPIVAAVDGETTRLRGSRVEPRIARHDGPDPKTTLILETKTSPPRELARFDWEGRWTIQGYSAAAHRYVLTVLAERGAALGILGVTYLGENGKAKDSAIVKAQWIALSCVASPDGRALAFVAKEGITVTGGFRLQLLDLATDQARDLGPPPAPPPALSEFRETDCKKTGFQWSLEGGYQPMDDGILVFSDGRLKASYGADGCRGRAKKRTVKEWPL